MRSTSPRPPLLARPPRVLLPEGENQPRKAAPPPAPPTQTQSAPAVVPLGRLLLEASPFIIGAFSLGGLFGHYIGL